MKGRLPRIVMVLVALAMTFSLVATVVQSADKASAQSGGLNSWARQDLPSTLKWQMAPNTDIWDLTAADDGTLFALVEDTSGPTDIRDVTAVDPAMYWDGLRWAVFPAWSDVALFKSTDGGYTWTLMWHIPASEDGAPICVVPQPGYVEGDATKDVVFVATGTRAIEGGAAPIVAGGPATGDIYRSMDGADNFTRITPRNPAIDLGGTITSMDVAENRYPEAAGTYMVAVGTASLVNAAGFGEGVWTWNEDNDRDWQDKQVVTSLPPAPFPGTAPAGNGMSTINLKFSPSWLEDGCLMAVIGDLGPGPNPFSPGIGTYLCFYDDTDGTWGGDVDSPTNAGILVGAAADGALDAHIAVGDDFSKTSNNYVFVSIGITFANPLNVDVYRIRGLATVAGPSTSTAMNLGTNLALGKVGATRLDEIVLQGTATGGTLYVGCEYPIPAIGPTTLRQATVFRGVQPALWPAWTPSFKPPSGAWPISLTDMQGTLMEASGGDFVTTSGVHVMINGFGGRMAFNGRGLLDDIAVSEDIPGYVNPGVPPLGQPLMAGTSWCLVEAVSEEASPTYETDKLLYVATMSNWYQLDIPTLMASPGLSLWRWTDGAHWERILKELVVLPTTDAVGNYKIITGMPVRTNGGLGNWVDDWTWWPRVPRGFSTDPYMFLLGGIGYITLQAPPITDMLWYSPDKGDTWIDVDQMPIGAAPVGAGLSEAGWWVEDNNTVFLGDMAGWIYRTTNRGVSWTEGALTGAGLEITTIITSPTYADDTTIAVGTYDNETYQDEIWLAQDAAMQDLENIGAEINTDPAWSGWHNNAVWESPIGGPVVNFDQNWSTNHLIYAATGGWLDRWQLVGTGSRELTRIDSTDVGVYRTEVNLNDPSASTWEQIWDADDFNAIAKAPQPLPNMLAPGQGPTSPWDIYRFASISSLSIGSEGSIYAPYAIWDMSYNSFLKPAQPPSPNPGPPLVANGYGRFTAGGVLRCLDGTQDTPEWNAIGQGLGEWEGLWLNRAPAGGSNTLISIAYDWQEWRFKLAIYDDTLCTKAPPSQPLSNDVGVGAFTDSKVSVTLEWGAMDADVYQWQLDDDCGFVAPLIKEGLTSETLVTATGLDPAVKYCWHVRALEPALSRWSDAQSFTTIIGAELIAPTLKAPKAGATILQTKPLFQWSGIGWADKYLIQVATDSGFASSAMVINENLGNVQAFEAPTELSYNTYYWRVKAMSDTSETEWSSMGVFTVAKDMPGGGTESWVWIFVALAVIMVVLIMTLIIKTRATV